MSVLRDFERQVLRLLVGEALHSDTIDLVCTGNLPTSFEFTGVGYYLTMSDSSLPSDREVLSHPLLVGTHDGVDCGFVIFLGDQELVLECHSWAGDEVPRNIRELPLEIRVSEQIL